MQVILLSNFFLKRPFIHSVLGNFYRVISDLNHRIRVLGDDSANPHRKFLVRSIRIENLKELQLLKPDTINLPTLDTRGFPCLGSSKVQIPLIIESYGDSLLNHPLQVFRRTLINRMKQLIAQDIGKGFKWRSKTSTTPVTKSRISLIKPQGFQIVDKTINIPENFNNIRSVPLGNIPRTNTPTRIAFSAKDHAKLIEIHSGTSNKTTRARPGIHSTGDINSQITNVVFGTNENNVGVHSIRHFNVVIIFSANDFHVFLRITM